MREPFSIQPTETDNPALPAFLLADLTESRCKRRGQHEGVVLAVASVAEQEVSALGFRLDLTRTKLTRYTMTSNFSEAPAIPSSSRGVTTMVSW
jgi:hypothetical protein